MATPNGDRRLSAVAIIVAVVSLCALSVGLIISVDHSKHGLDSASTPLVLTVLGFIATTLTSLVSLLKVDATRQDLHNGLIPAKVAEAVQTGLEDGTLSIKQDRTGVQERATDPPNQEGKTNG